MQAEIARIQPEPLPPMLSGVTVIPVNQHGKKLRRIRDEKGWTQDDLAQKAGLSRAQIQNMERGYPATRRSWAKVAIALALPVDEIAPPIEEDATPAAAESDALAGVSFDEVNRFYKLFRPMLLGLTEEQVAAAYVAVRDELARGLTPPPAPHSQSSPGAQSPPATDDGQPLTIVEGLSDKEVQTAAAKAKAKRTRLRLRGQRSKHARDAKG